MTDMNGTPVPDGSTPGPDQPTAPQPLQPTQPTAPVPPQNTYQPDRKSTRLNSSHDN